MDLRQTYNRIAEYWNKDHYTDTWSAAAEKYFVELLPGGATVLDVGCGSGIIAERFLNCGLAVTGIDFSEAMVALAKGNVSRGEFFVLDMRNLDTITETFDGVFARASLLHIPKAECPVVVAAMARRLKPGGHLFLAVKEIREGRGEEELVTEDDYGFSYERFFSYFTFDEICKFVHLAGLVVVHEEFVGSEGKRWIIVMAKK